MLMIENDRFDHVSVLSLKSDFGGCFVFQYLVRSQRHDRKFLVQIFSQLFGKRRHIGKIYILFFEYLLIHLLDPEWLEFVLLAKGLEFSGVED